MTSPDAAPQPVFIDFEGIDGSGKTTLSNRLVELLKQHGIQVHHARDGGVFRSEISKEIRTLTRDPRFLRMSDVTEFLLYVARDTQMIDEFIRPKLRPGSVVFSDRYLYSAVTHSHHARHLPRKEVNAVLDLAARGLWPDLVVYCDVDPLTSRMRKKIQKIRDQRLGDFGRKGLMGIGFREEMRKGFLELAKEDPDRWLVIDNAHSTIAQSLQRIYERVIRLLESKGYRKLKPLDLPADATPAVGRPVILVEGVRKALQIPGQPERQEAIRRIFFEELERLAGPNPSYVALFISGISTREANALRDKIVDREPALVAHGLQGLVSLESMQFRHRLKGREPVYVARSLYLLPELPEITALRSELLETAPAEIALSLRGLDTELAWQFRDRIGKKAVREVLMSLRMIDSDRAWELREKRARERNFPSLLESLIGIDSQRAWSWRESLLEEFLPWVLMSLRGIYGDRAWDLRQEHIERAPKIIIKSIGRSEDPRAYKLRQFAKQNVKEVLDSLSGLDSGPAWALRMELREKWPNTAVSSLGAGAQSERAWKFRWDMLRDHADNLLLLKHVVKASFRTSEQDIDFLDEDDDEGDFT